MSRMNEPVGLITSGLLFRRGLLRFRFPVTTEGPPPSAGLSLGSGVCPDAVLQASPIATNSDLCLPGPFNFISLPT